METKARILIVEDETAIRIGLVDVFVFHGYEVDYAEDGHSGLAKALSGNFDLILLDVMLPGINGFDICERIRQNDKEQAIIMLTAKTRDDDIIQGLSLGADDYVAKPFSVAQLVLRVQAVLRRILPLEVSASDILLAPDLRIDIKNLSGTNGSKEISFTRREADVLYYLNNYKDRAVSREELLHKVWGYPKDSGLETRTVDIHIAKLRRKLEIHPKNPVYLITVRGAGYRLMLS